MELLKVVQEMQTEEYKHNLRRESFKHLCGLNLTDFQIDVLMANCENNSQTIYSSQRRREGTSTALLLKIYQSIFLEERTNHKVVICKYDNMARSLCTMMVDLLDPLLVRRHSRYRIELECGTSISFANSNPINLLGVRTGPEVFFDNYRIEDERHNSEMTTIIRPLFPTHTHYFIDGYEDAEFNRRYSINI